MHNSSSRQDFISFNQAKEVEIVSKDDVDGSLLEDKCDGSSTHCIE